MKFEKVNFFYGIESLKWINCVSEFGWMLFPVSYSLFFYCVAYQFCFFFSIQISGQHYETFEAYFISLDTDRIGIIKAQDAARFLKKSGLSDVVLSRVRI